MSDPRELLDAYANEDHTVEFSGPDCYHKRCDRFEKIAPRAFAALRAVLDLHKPETIAVCPDPDAPPGAPMGERTICPECSAGRPYVDSPCDTVKPILRELEGK